MRRSIFAGLLSLVLTATATAQVSPIPGTGCGSSGPTLVGNAPRIGQTITIAHQLPCNSPGGFGFVIVGFAQLNVALNGCGSQRCVIGASPDFLTLRSITANVRLPIPNDPNLVGGSIYAQAGCLFTIPPPPCVSIVHQAVKITVQR